jgi:RHS repeat-associated protein
MKRGAATLASISYALDSAGQLKSATQTGLPGAGKPEYEYDENERLKKGAGTSFGYDAANNPTTLGASTLKYDKANQLEEGAGTKYTFDKFGERTEATPEEGPSTTYGYDQAGNLISVTRTKEGEVKEIKDTYAYDGAGLRASETINGTTTHMAWDINAELPLLLGDGTNSYIYGPEGLPFEQINSKEEASYLHHDRQGSTRLITNASGETKGTYTYTPYGAVEGQTGTATTPLGYGGQYTSSDTGFIYLRARVYDPSTAQFLSVDPLVAKTGEPYSYARGNPVNSGDPSGKLPIGLGSSWGISIKIGGFNFQAGGSSPLFPFFCPQANYWGAVGNYWNATGNAWTVAGNYYTSLGANFNALGNYYNALGLYGYAQIAYANAVAASGYALTSYNNAQFAYGNAQLAYASAFGP